MRRALLIGVMVTVLALSGIGAAFATSMNMTGLGSLAIGEGDLPEVHVVGVTWVMESDPPGYVTGVRVNFSRSLMAETEFDVRIYDADNNQVFRKWYGAPAGPIPYGSHKWFTFGENVNIDEIYSLRIIVAEKTAFGSAA